MHRQARAQLSEAELQAALEQCAQEPIHSPGGIQPHGLLLAVAPATGLITHCSATATAFLQRAPEDVVGSSLSAIFGAENAARIAAATVKAPLEPLETIALTLNGRSFDMVASRSGDRTILEFEPQPQDSCYSSDKFYYDQLRHFAVNIRESHNLDRLYDLVVGEIFRLTGIDRVKLYRFDPDWNGEVVAEARKDFMPSYRGLHFPASDIPEQARRLYTKNYLRIIPDIGYRPAPIYPAAGPDAPQPLDLSQSVLRAVSPVHIQYLDNMNIRASMSISVIQDGRLWGLIACHNNTPLYVPYRIRMVAEVIGHIFSAHLSNLQEIERHSDDQRRKLLVEKLMAAVQQDPGADKLFNRIAPLAMEALKASGIAYRANERIFFHGETPPLEQLDALLRWLKRRSVKDMLQTDDLGALVADEPALRSLSGGMLACNVTHVDGEFVLWFRPSIVKNVHWAGNPEKQTQDTKAGYRLTPRSSFALWQENVRGKAPAWTTEDSDTARDVVKALLESKKLAADQANLAKSEFMANLSHELRTPMNAILGLSTILATSQPLSDRQRMYITTLKSSADNLLTLINDLLDVAKIESRSIVLENIAFDMQRLLQENMSMLAVRAAEKSLALKLDTARLEAVPYCGDPTRLRQVLINLIGNALKFTDQGSISVTVASERLPDGTRRVSFEVTDTGIGIVPEKLGSIFEKFTQADPSINRRFGGTGLGLSITKTLVELMGGTISVRSTVGEGSTFAFSIPLKTATDAETTVPPAPEEPSLPPTPAQPKILVVEDFEPNALVAASLLDDFGYGYDIAKNGLEAVERVKSQNYFAILMDVQMHGMNGFDATAAIRRLETAGKRRHYIIGVTAHALAGDRERCYDAGMDDYLPKPFNPRELKSKLLAAVFSNQRQTQP